MLTFRHSPYGTSVLVLDDTNAPVFDASVRPYLLQRGINLAPLIDNYDAPFAVKDGEGKKVVWVEDGETHVDETGEIEIVDNVAEALIARAGQ